MPAKSSAKLGEAKGHRGGKRQEERSTVRAWLTADWSRPPHPVAGTRQWQTRRGAHCNLRRAAAACWGTTRGSTWSDHEVRAAPEVVHGQGVGAVYDVTRYLRYHGAQQPPTPYSPSAVSLCLLLATTGTTNDPDQLNCQPGRGNVTRQQWSHLVTQPAEEGSPGGATSRRHKAAPNRQTAPKGVNG